MPNKKSIRFQPIQTHNSHDTHVKVNDDGRIEANRNVNERIGLIVSLLATMPGHRVDTVDELVSKLNRKFRGKSNYSYNDVYPQLSRMVELGVLTHVQGGSWTLSPRGERAWKSVNKVVVNGPNKTSR
jgi:hypothetical protein